jgi:hypothetical protein
LLQEYLARRSAVSTSGLVRLGAATAAIGGSLLLLTDVVAWFFAYPRPVGGVLPIAELSGLWAAVFLIGLVSTLGGLVAIYVRQAEAAGALGLVGFGVAFLGTALSVGVAWTPTVFAVPSLAVGAGGYPDVAWVGLAIAFVGWTLLGVATTRGGVLPRAPAVLLVVGGALSWLAFVGLPGTLVLDMAIAWMGLALLTGRAAAPARGTAGVQ